MTLEEQKKEMLSYKDLLGGELVDTDAIKNAQSVKDLADVFQRQSDLFDDMASDAKSHLDHFRCRIGVTSY